jgi:hypothetical protein
VFQSSALGARYRTRETQLLVGLTGLVSLLNGLGVTYQLFLREKNARVGLSDPEWVAYTVGPSLVDPLVLFCTLALFASRVDRMPSLPVLLPGLVGAVLLGTLAGQTLGERLLRTGWTPLARASVGTLFTLDLRTLPYWRDLVVPPARSVLTAVAALALGRAASD